MTLAVRLWICRRLKEPLNGYRFRASVLRSGDNSEFRANKSMLQHSTEQANEFAILGPEPNPVPPADLQSALYANTLKAGLGILGIFAPERQ